MWTARPSPPWPGTWPLTSRKENFRGRQIRPRILIFWPFDLYVTVMNLYDFKTSIENFLSFLLLERGLSANTAAAYGRDLRQWEKFCGEIGASPLPPGKNELLLFQRHLTRSDKSPATKQRIMAAMRTWMSILIRRACWMRTGLPSLPARDRPCPGFLTRNLTELFQACSGTSPLDLRDRALFRRLTVRPRAGELCALKLRDIDFGEKPSGPRARRRAGNPLGEAAGGRPLP